MRISKIICDRCGGEIGGPLAHIVPIFIDPETGDTVMGRPGSLPDQTGKEYCITCTERIMAFANNVTKSSGQGQPLAEAGENRMKRYTANIPTVQTVAAHGGMAAADASAKEPEAVQEPEQSGKGAKTRPEAEQSRKEVETAQETADGSGSGRVQEPAAGDKQAKPPGRGVDVGKVLALKAAGWKAKEIAADMHIKEQTVYDCLYRHKKRQAEAATATVAGGEGGDRQ